MLAATPAATATDIDPATGKSHEAQKATVQRGDSLWRISRKMLGQGARYTLIYENNTQQIRDPHRIYPGQIFVLPEMN